MSGITLDHDFLCNCECGCRRKAEGSGTYPTLCDVCGLSVALNSSKCGLPYVPTVWKPLEPSVPISQDKVDAAIDKAMGSLI